MTPAETPPYSPSDTPPETSLTTSTAAPEDTPESGLAVLSPSLIEYEFQAVLAPVLDEPVLIRGDMDARPEGPHCVIAFIKADPLEHDVNEFPEDGEGASLEELAREETLCSVEIRFHGRYAMDRALRCTGILRNNRRNFDLWRILGFAGLDPVKSKSPRFFEAQEERARFRINFYADFGARYPADWFSSSKWELELPDKPYHEDLNIPE